jgi:pyruvate dehydrogenase E2 component (dihydrolipoamide acetyltransferase)
MNVPGRWLKRSTIWRKISLNTWSAPDNATIFGLLEIDAGPLNEYLKRRSVDTGAKCTMTHAVARCLAILLRRYPEANVLLRGRRIWLRRDVDIFHQVAMPIEGEKGKADLSGAIIRQADTKDVSRMATELREQAEAIRQQRDGEMARTRNLLMAMPNFLTRWVLKLLGWLNYNLNLSVPTSPRDPFGGAMVTSVGMLGIKMGFAPLVTFSRAPLIVMVNTVEDKAVVRDGQIVIRPILTLTASIDHRIMDGVQAGQIARDMKEILEQPDLLDQGLDAAALPPPA